MSTGTGASPFAAHRERAMALRERYPFADEVLGLYLPLLDVWQDGWDNARAEQPDPAKLAHWLADRVLPHVVAAAVAAGPGALADGAARAAAGDDAAESIGQWLAGADLPPVARFLARASAWPALHALESAGAACAEDPSPRGGRTCPRCGGLPQFGLRGAAGEALVTGGRSLGCARCGHMWPYSSSSCPFCGEATGARRTVYAEQHSGPVVGTTASDGAATFPHMRIDACASCQRYLIDVDASADPAAVAEVDELVAVPLHLYAAELGLSRITPNLMGF